MECAALQTDHADRHCSNRVFYSTLYWQPVQIHKNMFAHGSFSNKRSGTVHHELNFV